MAHLVTITGPSGVGKDAIVEALIKRNPSWVVASSVTTRPKRRIESTGKRYFFVTDDEFDRLIADKKLLEWQPIHSWRYGTLKETVANAIDQGKTVLMNIDIKGARELKEKFPELAPLVIFLTFDHQIPLEKAIGDRFKNDPKRRNLSEKELEVRIKTARFEMSDQRGVDTVIENREGELAYTVEQVEKAMEAHK